MNGCRTGWRVLPHAFDLISHSGNAVRKTDGGRCLHLTADCRCNISATPPAVCWRLRPTRARCGETRNDVLRYRAVLERATAPQV